MDSWPTDDRNDKFNTSGRKEKDIDGEKESTRSYPRLEPGSLNAITLRQTLGRFEWTSVVHSKGHMLKSRKNLEKVFPATRSSPLYIPPTSVVQRAEQGAHFLRTYLPDVDIPAELIRDEIKTDTEISRRRESFDPYVGDLLTAVHCHIAPGKHAAFLAFPMGDTGQSLNISPFSYTRRRGVVFEPASIPCRTFNTPIQQIVAAPFDEKQNFHFAVRTMASTSMLAIKGACNDFVADSSNASQINELAKINHVAIGNRPPVDISIPPFARGALLVNDHGAIYKWSVGGDTHILPRLYAGQPNSSMRSGDPFWRLASTQHLDGCILASEETVQRLDFRAVAPSLTLYATHQPGELVTSVENFHLDTLVRLVSTSDVLWVDDRFTKRPLLSYKHGRQFDRTLQTHTIYLQTPLTFLTSRKNGLVTVYDVSRSDDQLLPSRIAPYSLPPILDCNMRHSEFAFFRHPSDLRGTDVDVYQMSERGSIHHISFTQSPETAPPESPGRSPLLGYEWSTGVRNLEVVNTKLHADTGSLGIADANEVDLNAAYRKIFSVEKEEMESGPPRNPERFYETLERMPNLLRNSDVPLEHMLTTFDVAFRAGDEPDHVARADFLTQSTLDPTRGIRAFSQGRIVTDALVRQSSWHHNISATLKKVGLDVPNDMQSFQGSLRARQVVRHSDQPSSSTRRELEAAEQLTFDLGLSTDVFSPQRFLTRRGSNLDDFESMSLATEAMSLADEPPPVHFGYFRPVPKGTKDHYANFDQPSGTPPSEELTTPLGVRLLLQEWEIGSEPSTFTYRDPYDASLDPMPVHLTRKPSSPTEGAGKAQHTIPVMQSQRPPTIVTCNRAGPPTVTNNNPLIRPTLGGQSQGFTTDVTRRIPNFGSQLTIAQPAVDGGSQDFMTNTQILPGPYGGRQSLVKKKAAKKRLGGF